MLPNHYEIKQVNRMNTITWSYVMTDQGVPLFLNLIFIKDDLPISRHSMDMSMIHKPHTADVLHDSTFLDLENLKQSLSL
ncbi:hypothetical protein CXF95_08130 [Paraglaciecola sp. MB-3u-78]|nr:hypothetical protein CXF95_08130 [Paraglaciecola sp. MB-3u-78]